MGLRDWFSLNNDSRTVASHLNDVKEIDESLSVTIKEIEGEYIKKSKNDPKPKAYEEPLLGNLSMNPDYKEAPSILGTANLFKTLKHYSRRYYPQRNYQYPCQSGFAVLYTCQIQ